MSGKAETTNAVMQQDSINANARLRAPAFSFAQEETVILAIGPEQNSLVAHESHLKLNIDFFKTALKKEWVECQTRIINLPEDDTETITDYLTFTYGSDLPTTTLKTIPVGGPGHKPWELLARLYVLGERLLNTPLCNAVIKEMVLLASLADDNHDNYFMPTSVSNICYDGTPTGSNLRRLIVDKHIFECEQDWINDQHDHPAFLAELSQALLAKVAARQPYAEDYLI